MGVALVWKECSLGDEAEGVKKESKILQIDL